MRRNKFLEHDLGAAEIKKYMQKCDIPEWFRGISNFQVDASNKLFDALRYDLEQGSTYRVRACLVSLGLSPMVSNQQLRKLMCLSHGNDLAFLWFLIESCYKTKGQAGYSLNEQILYSAIAHLDMVTTLRELDRLLPHNPKQEKKAPKKNQQHIIIKPDQFKQFNIPKKANSPYLQPIKTPNLYHRPIQLKRPDPKISLAEYEIYKDPNYVVKNESNRWFASYVTKKSRRIVSCILKDTIERLFEKFEYTNDKFIGCEHHKRLMEAEKKLKCEIEKKARAKIEKYFDVDAMRDERTRKRILDQIERDVKMLMQKSLYDTERVQSKQNKNPKKKQKIEILEGEDSIRYCVPKNVENDKWNKSENKAKRISEEEKLKSEESHSISTDSVCPMSITKLCGTLEEPNECDWFPDPFCKLSSSKKKSPFDNDESKEFFKANQKHKPWHFDYQEIFNIENARPPTSEQRVKLSFVKKLNGQMSASPDITGNVDVKKAAEIEFNRQWSESLGEYNRKVDAEPKIEEKEIIPLQFDRKYFDPDDKQYMIYMLKCCFEHMKMDKKFVLASMPDAYKLPIFKFFIQDRYGKRYSLQQRKKLFDESLKILNAFEKLTKIAPTPKISDFSKPPYVSYGSRNYLLAKNEKVRQKYYDELDQIIMHQSRIFWFAVQPYLCMKGPPRNTFFAYMPSRTVGITRFRQWNGIMEFVDAQKEWRMRQKKGWRN